MRTGIRRLRGGYYKLHKPVSRPIRYRAVSVMEEARDPPDPIYLSVPEGVSPRVVALAKELSGKGRSDEERILRLKAFFSKAGHNPSLRFPCREQDFKDGSAEGLHHLLLV